MTATIHSIQIGLPQNHPADPSRRGIHGKAWRSAFLKSPATSPVGLTSTGLAGDGQADLENHGGLDKAVNSYPLAHYQHWQSEFPGLSFPHGAFGENLTLAGIDESTVCIGDTFAVSGSTAALRTTQPRQPCWKLARRHGIDNFPQRFIATGFTGWYFAAAAPGLLQAGQILTRTSNPYPDLTLQAANLAFYDTAGNRDLATALTECPALSTSWRSSLKSKLAAM